MVVGGDGASVCVRVLLLCLLTTALRPSCDKFMSSLVKHELISHICPDEQGLRTPTLGVVSINTNRIANLVTTTAPAPRLVDRVQTNPLPRDFDAL